MAEERHGRTLFVRNIPYSATNESLENIFSDIGPIKSCFVVKDKESGKCRGFGYVKFTLLEDAEKALDTVKKIEGRNVHIVYAKKKEKITQVTGYMKESVQGKNLGAVVNPSSGRYTVTLDSDPGREKRFGQPKHLDKEHTDTEIEQENTNEKNQQNKKQKKGQAPMKGQKQAPNPLNEGKRARLIIRNLSFRCTNEELIKMFGQYGDVVDVHIPKKESGARLGFGFVQFKNRTQAGMAVKELNGQEICGRVVAVDWALPKDKFEAKLTVKLPTTDVNIDEKPAQDESMEVDDDDDVDDDSDVSINRRMTDHNDVANSCDEDIESSEDEEEEKENTEEDNSTSDDEDETELSDDGDDDGGESDSGIKKAIPQKNQQCLELKSDVEEGRTVFVRNLPYAIENEELEEFFSQYGSVKYARAVIDKTSGLPKGSAFIQFQSKEAADSCVEAASGEEDSRPSLGGRSLLVSLAVSRHQAGEFSGEKDKKKEQKDTRNLYLAREGMIRAGTAAAKDVSAKDLALRMKIDAAKRLKLKDQNVFVSSTRLCVHNIPPTITEQQLREIIVKSAGDKQARLVECRIMRDLNRVNSQGVGKSRGFAFCAFTRHEHALSALQKLNNNPDIFGDKKRPIVEFSLENRKALEAKQKRLEKSRVKQKQKTKETEDASQSTSGRHRKKRKHNIKDGFLPLEQRKEQDRIARSLHKGPLGLPSHSGPKQRHKPRPNQQQVKDRKKTHGMGRRNEKMGWKQPGMEKSFKEKSVKVKNSKKRRNDTDSFDKMVAAYKQKIMSSANF